VEKRLMKINEAANYLEISVVTLRAWHKKKLFMPYKVGLTGYRYYTKEQLDELLKNGLDEVMEQWNPKGGK